MIGTHHRLGFAVDVIVIPINSLIQILRIIPCRQICRFGHLCQAVTVDIHGIQGAEHSHLRGNTGSGGEHDVGQLPVPHGQDIRHGLGRFHHAGNKQCRFPAAQGSLRQTPLLAQLGHGHGHPCHGAGHQSPILPHIIFRAPFSIRKGPQHHQILHLVFVQIHNSILDIIRPQEFRGPVRPQRIHGQRLQLRAHTPADNQLRSAVPVQIIIADAVNRSTAALNRSRQLIGIPCSGKDADLQGFFIRRVTEKSQSLFPAVSVQIPQLHRLDIGSGYRCGILRAAFQDLVDLIVQLRILRRKLGKTVQLLGIKCHLDIRTAACGQPSQKGQQSDQKHCPPYPSHRVVPFPAFQIL